MDAALAAIFLFPGLAIGSFLNVVAARVPLKRSVVKPRSACMSCGNELAWYDNIPVVSYIVLRGRCRNCGVHIALRYPLVELVTALLISGSVWKFGLSGDAAIAAFFCTALVAVSATDLEHRIIPNRIVVPAAVIVLAAQTALHPSVEWTLCAFGASGFLFAAALAYPKGMGMGDVKLAGVMGLYLGLSVAPALLIAFLAGSLVGVAILARHGAAARKRGVPFAPFLALGGLVALMVGPELIDLYARTFLNG
jgi:leader peptidase (prepilin peptidase)/N-methyltransferase